MSIYRAVIGNRTLVIDQDIDCDNPLDGECRPYDIYSLHRRLTFADDEMSGFPDDECVAKFKVYVYQHGNYAFSLNPFGCPFDSGMGAVFVFTKERMEAAGIPLDRPHAELAEMLERELKDFQHYVNGEEYGFVLTVDGVVKDSCYSFFGDDWQSNGIADHLGEKNADLLAALELAQ